MMKHSVNVERICWPASRHIRGRRTRASPRPKSSRVHRLCATERLYHSSLNPKPGPCRPLLRVARGASHLHAAAVRDDPGVCKAPAGGAWRRPSKGRRGALFRVEADGVARLRGSGFARPARGGGARSLPRARRNRRLGLRPQPPDAARRPQLSQRLEAPGGRRRAPGHGRAVHLTACSGPHLPRRRRTPSTRPPRRSSRDTGVPRGPRSHAATASAETPTVRRRSTATSRSPARTAPLDSAENPPCSHATRGAPSPSSSRTPTPHSVSGTRSSRAAS